MKRSIKQSLNSGGNLRASSSNVDNFRNNQNNIKKISNNLVPDTYYFRNNTNYINIKLDKFNNINNTTSKHSENKNYNYNIIEPHTQSRTKNNMNYGRYLNGINDINEELRELSKSIEKSDDVIRKLEEENNKYLNVSNNKNMNLNLNLASNKKNRELFNSYINININRNNEFNQGENSFRFSCLNNNTNNNLEMNNTSNIYDTNNNINNDNNYYNIVDNKFNYKEYKKNNTQNKQRKGNNYIQNQNNIKVGLGKTENMSMNKIKEINIRNDSLERTNVSLNKKLLDKEKLITKLVRTINILKNDNQRFSNINNESENKLNFLIQELNDSKKILAELKAKDDLILKMGNKIKLLEEGKDIYKTPNDEKFSTEKKNAKK